MAIEKNIGYNTLQFRKSAGLSQEELCLKASLNQAQLSKIENGKIKIGLETLERLAKALGVAPYELLKNEPDSQILREKLEAIEKLPKKKQQHIIDVLDALLLKEGQKGK